MWTLQSIQASNYLSFKNVSYDFSQHCYIVCGEVEGEEGVISNGAGKTSFIDILPICLFGISTSGRTLKNCINYNCEESITQCNLYNIKDKTNLHVKRVINRKENRLYITVNEEIPKIVNKGGGGIDIKEGNKFIIDILNISKEDLFNHYFISKRYYTSFLNKTNTEKIHVINNLSGIYKLDELKEDLKKEYKRYNEEIVKIKIDISGLEGQLHSLDITKQQEYFEERKKKRLKELAKEIEIFIHKINTTTNEIAIIEKTLIKKKKELKKLQTQTNFSKNQYNIVNTPFDSTSFQQKINILTTNIKNIEKEKISSTLSLKNKYETISKTIIQLDSQINKLRAQYKNELIECPNCNTQFSISSKKNISTIVDEGKALNVKKVQLQKEREVIVKHLTNEEEKFNNKKVIVQKEINTLEETLQKERNKEHTIIQNVFKEYTQCNETFNIQNVNYKKEETTLSNKKYYLVLNNKSLTEFKKEKEELLRSSFDDTKLLNTINDIKNKIKKEKVALEHKNSYIDDIDLWINVHIKEFSRYIGNQTVCKLCDIANHILSQTGISMEVALKEYQENDKGALTPYIKKDIDVSYTNLSEGEKTKLDLCFDIAFQEIVNQKSKQGGLCFHQNDELLNNLDSEGIKEVAIFLNKLNITSLLVTHSGADNKYPNTIVVKKTNGVSQLV